MREYTSGVQLQKSGGKIVRISSFTAKRTWTKRRMLDWFLKGSQKQLCATKCRVGL